MNASIPIRTRHLFQELDEMLLAKLKSLSWEEWHCRTLAGSWTVKQVAAHLLDGNLRAVSMLRDSYFGESPGRTEGYGDLVGFLNRLNADWVTATNRLSPEVLTALLESSGKEYRNLIRSLKPFDKALFSVAWAGEQESPNWFHVAREYTEKWHHTQQIFYALDPGNHTLLSKRLYQPYLETSMRALPYHYRQMDRPLGTLVKFTVEGEFSQTWWLKRGKVGWQLLPFSKVVPSAELTVPAEFAWRIFSKGIVPNEAVEAVVFRGDRELALHFLKALAVMA
ncbi:maleylpyruvate isomerase N-terminal domain-containing protein [Algoriphagus sp. A40]|uniref:maleylpyruvate isomerase N-terminal domain-containing protein n=1 Tax=Algoriphagus sp. A40 TaxID=1945863 RepID=UPI0009842C25|nr:maleylpyruvate isomerase N-terminal domain-containing protein [Algoriphagus sp. A40]OOG76467.1 hypothetical protein B0E43_08235 [Algoriphagus sp. A40]